MKILFISMPSLHANRWIENLKDEGHELYWFDVLERGKLKISIPVKQFTNWKKRKLPYIKGEYWFSKNKPSFFEFIRPLLEKTENEALGEIIEEVNPDLVHSFEMQSCSYPILKTMKKYKHIKWLYSCWGSDLFFYQDKNPQRAKIKAVLQRIDYLQTDCKRDYNLARKSGFKGMFLGVIPGGAGYDLEKLSVFKKPLQKRNIILIKGYQHRFGRALNSVAAIKNTQNQLINYKVVIFGAHPAVKDYVEENKLDCELYIRHQLSHKEVLKLMGKSLLYIGNSISDGIPNTLLEAMVMQAFPIQSNPGGATSEIIEDGKNGLLIHNPNDVGEISTLILKAINDKDLIQNAANINRTFATEHLDYNIINKKIKNIYNTIACA